MEPVYESSGNVYADFGDPNPEEALAKSKLAMQLYDTIQQRCLTYHQAAEIMGTRQSAVSGIVRGQLSQYTPAHLTRLLQLLEE